MSDGQIRKGHSHRIADADDYRLNRPFTHDELIADKRHLRMLSGGYYLMAIALIIMGLLPLFYLVASIVQLSGAIGKAPQGEEGIVWIVFGVSLVVNLLVWTSVSWAILAGRSLIRRRRYTFCVVMAALVCALPPLGTILGLCTMLVLMRDSVKELFMHGEIAFQPESEYD